MLVPLCIVAALAVAIAVGLRASSGLRGYVGGESLWTKSQKAGVVALNRFAVTAHPADFRAYEASRAIPEADRLARLELARPDADVALAAAHLVDGGNHPDDAADMAWLARRFGGNAYLRRAVDIWATADTMRDRLHERALVLRTAVERSDTGVVVRATLDSIAVLDARLTVLERDFSSTLADAGRWLHRAILGGTVLLGLLLALVGAVAIGRVARGERRAFLIAQQRDAERLASERALRERDEQLRQAQKMEAVGRLAGGVAHDFNNLLMVMRGNLELALEDARGQEVLTEDIAEVKRAVDRAAALTAQLLTFSRQRSPDLRVLHVPALLDGARPLIVRALGPGVRLVVDAASDLPAVLGDAGQLDQVLLNLAVNARDAMPDGGTLRVRASRRFGAPSRHGAAGAVTAAPAEWVVIEVTDSGHGIPAEIRERIFEPFFTTKEVGKGTGLGLATAYGIMAGLGGAIDVREGEFGGTTFTLWLQPTDEAEAVESREAEAAPAAADAGRVLVVEDQPEVRRLTCRILERAGYAVIEAANGREALDLVANVPGTIDLILTDLVMPDIGGRALADALRERGTPRPILFMSGYTPDLEPPRDAFGRPAELLAKPFSTESLLVRVREAIEHGRADEAAT